MKPSQEKMEVTRNPIWPKLEETVKNWMDDVLSSIDQWTQTLHEELNVMLEEKQLGLHAVTMSPGMLTKNFHEELNET
jgi:hypothetical protein